MEFLTFSFKCQTLDQIPNKHFFFLFSEDEGFSILFLSEDYGRDDLVSSQPHQLSKAGQSTNKEYTELVLFYTNKTTTVVVHATGLMSVYFHISLGKENGYFAYFWLP